MFNRLLILLIFAIALDGVQAHVAYSILGPTPSTLMRPRAKAIALPGSIIPNVRGNPSLVAQARKRIDPRGRRHRIVVNAMPVGQTSAQDARVAIQDLVSSDGFEVLDQLGKGNQGVVWKVRKIETNEEFALKATILPQDEAKRQRLLTAAKIETEVNHPLLLKSLKSWIIQRDDGELLLSLMPVIDCDLMQVIQLFERLREKNILSKHPELSAHIARQVATALHELHLQGVLHRDMKPSNIFISGAKIDFDSENISIEEVIKKLKEANFLIGDFGHSGYMNNLVGTPGSPRYMPLDVVQFRQYSEASDFYGYGMAMYELLAGSPFFNPQSPQDFIPRLEARLSQFADDSRLNDADRRLSPEALDFLRKLITSEPGSRMDYETIMNHHFTAKGTV